MRRRVQLPPCFQQEGALTGFGSAETECDGGDAPCPPGAPRALAR